MSGTINNLTDLLVSIRADTADRTTEEAFDLLQELLGDDIRVRCEISPGDQSQQDNPVAQSGSRFAYLNNLKVSRVLLTSNRQHADFSREISRQCNGVVLEYPSWRVLAAPGAMFNPKYRVTEVVSKISDYDVYDIKDGTTVTLYWYSASGETDGETDGRWCLSSTNGFDVSNYQWMGPSTYMNALMSIAKNYPDFSFDKLDKNKSYTVGFRHREFHPLVSDMPKMWFIQSCDTGVANKTGEIIHSTSENIGIPLQTISSLPELSGGSLQRWITDKNSQSLNKYISSVRNGAEPEIHYGFVLRSKTQQSDIIIESELLKTIRTLMYNLPKRQHQNATSITPANRQEYTVLRAYLSHNTKYTFLNLFPQFEDKFRRFDEIFNKLSARIISLLRNRNPRESARIAQRNKRAGLSHRIETLAVSFADHIRNNIAVNVMDSQGPSIVLDFLMNPKHLDMYYTLLVDTA